MVNAQAVVPTLSVYRAKNVISMLSALMLNVPIALNVLLVKLQQLYLYMRSM
jgi:hypothetical protein